MHIMQRMSRLLPMLFFVALAACESQPRVHSDFNPGYDFASVRKIAIIGPAVAAGSVTQAGDLISTRIENAVRGVLQSRGYQIVQPRDAELLVSWFLTTRNKTDITTYNTGVGYRCWAPACRSMATDVSVRNYQEGTLFIDFIDARTHQLQWRGAASKRVDPSRSSAERTKVLHEGVTTILGAYPPGKQ
jgi:hypothetical protein